MALQCYTRGALRHTLDVHWRCVKEIYTMFYGVIHQFVHPLLVNDIALSLGIGHSRPAHATISEERNLVFTQSRKTAIGHLVSRNRSKFSCLTIFFFSSIAPCQSCRSGGDA